MSLVVRALLFVPILYLVMIVYVSPQCRDVAGTLRLARSKMLRVLFWTAVIVLVMEAIEFVAMP